MSVKTLRVDGHDHDGTRRYEIKFRSAGVSCSFYSDAVTEDGAWAHFKRCIQTTSNPVLCKIGPDDWLT